MMRSDMPKQIMAYRNGGGLPSLATVPVGYSKGGSIFSKLKSGIESVGSQIKSDIKEIMDNAGKPISEQSQSYRDKTEASKKRDSFLPPSQRSKESLGRRLARQRREAEAAEAAEAIDQGVGSLDTNVGANNSDVMNAYITNVLERDDLSAVEKLEFAQSLADTYGVAGGTGIQSVADNLSNVALDPTSSLSDAERVNALTSLGTYSGTDYSGLINTLNNQIANNNLANINNIATTTPGANIINNMASTLPINTVEDTAMVPAAPATYTGYAPIVPASNINTAGIGGLPSTNTAAINPYTFTAYTPGTFNSAVNPLVLPPLG